MVDLTENCPSGQLLQTAAAFTVLVKGQFCGGEGWYGALMLLFLLWLWP